MKFRNRLNTVLIALALVPAIAVTAKANQSGLYASLGGLYVLPTDSDTSYSEGDFKLTGTIPLDSGPGFTAAIGYGAPDGLRGEIEIGYRSSSWDELSNLNLSYQGGSVASDDLSIGGDLTTISLMANGIMVFDASWGVKPYVGAGVGFAQHDASTDAFTLTNNGDSYPIESSSSDDTVFAYQLMLGVAYPLSEKAEARFGYRYFATGEADLDGTKADYASHNIDVGILFRF